MISKNEIDYLLDIGLKTTNCAAKKAKEFLDNPEEISSNGKDIKTLADVKVNEIIIKNLSITKYQIISEESINKKSEKIRWIVDPIDGTMNFSRNFPYSSISISLWVEDEPFISIVKNIFSGDCFVFSKGKLSTLNGNIIKTSNKSSIEKSIIATGFPSNSNITEKNLKRLINNVQKFKKVRAIGSASLMLAYVASGIFDAYFEDEIYIWDVAAGLGLVKGSGGKFFIEKYKNSDKCKVFASNHLIYDEAKLIFK